MNHSTTLLDVRDLDRLYLATIAGADYYELRQIVKEENGRRAVVGLASAWPVIEARAQKAELERLLTESECHIAELIEEVSTLRLRRGAYEEEIATLRAAVLETPHNPPNPPEGGNQRECSETEAETFVAPLVLSGLVCETCGRGGWKNKRALIMHRRRKHDIRGNSHPKDSAWTCAECGATTGQSIGDPTRCKQCLRTSTPLPPPLRGDTGGLPVDIPWRCASCNSDTHTRSVSDPTKCLRCAADSLSAHKNGHLVEA
jgi:hypothetical protein